ncbi:hypothetical protein [Cellulomonas sp. C5510]|uniref:hypothetical protein n=1 Tax=Cellulomonas sp. C5510 TaxID=2871170 RepID=UPI001C96AE55|nr:hypothetical protein [Cellulomonas sp. C5510]QZN84925.1 hypothetical protein K5O09_14095 [Cellulomonas sp. C5510]
MALTGPSAVLIAARRRIGERGLDFHRQQLGRSQVVLTVDVARQPAPSSAAAMDGALRDKTA